MSGFFRRSVIGAAMSVLSVVPALVSLPAHAVDWVPPAPIADDYCGTKYDRYFTPLDDYTEYLSPSGESLGNGVWHPTGGASTVTVIARNYIDPERTFTLTFGTDPGVECVEAEDTVTTEVLGCNPTTGGTDVRFTYTNQAEPFGAAGGAHTRPALSAYRWDMGHSAFVWFTNGEVADGQQVTATGGSDPDHSAGAYDYFLAPGTYDLTLFTVENGYRVLPNRLFIPACGPYELPPGDPNGEPVPVVSAPTASIGRCRAHTVRVFLDARKATSLTNYRVSLDPRRGSTVVKTFDVTATGTKTVSFTRQRTGTLVKVTFAGKSVQRTLRC